MSDVLDPRKLADGYLEKLRAADTEARRLTRAAEKLRKQQNTQDEKRQALEADLHKAQQTVSALGGERADLQLKWVEADFNVNTAAKRAIQQRRTELDKELAQAQEDERNLCESLDALEPLDREAAAVAVELDAFKTGNAFAFAEQLKQALMRHESDLRSRIDKARKTLPKYSYETMEAVKVATDEEYAEKKARQEEEQERRRARERARQEAANRTYQAATDERGFIVGWHVKDQQDNIIGYEKATLAEV